MTFLILEFLDGLDDPGEKVDEEGDEECLAEEVDEDLAGGRRHCGAKTVRFAANRETCAAPSLFSYWHQ